MAQPNDEFYAIALGTAGGPIWWGSSHHEVGICTAIVTPDGFYLIDAGYGAWAALNKAGLRPSDLRGIFLTHLHSDHLADLPALLMFSAMAIDNDSSAKGKQRKNAKIPILGPGARGCLPLVSPFSEYELLARFAEQPSPGTQDSIYAMMSGFAIDTNDRVLDELRSAPLDLFAATDIALPVELSFDANDPVPPRIEPFVIFDDGPLRVTATLVTHPPMAPAFAFRFDFKGRSVTISGDTAPSENLERLAAQTTLLMHEAIDFSWLDRRFGDEKNDQISASIDHHHRSHTSPLDAARLAERAQAQMLALHHLVPANADPTAWAQAAEAFSGKVIVPHDGEVILLPLEDAFQPDSQPNIPLRNVQRMSASESR